MEEEKKKDIFEKEKQKKEKINKYKEIINLRWKIP